MSEDEELQAIAEIVANPSEEGFERLQEIMRGYSGSEMARLEACHAILLIGFGPPSKEASEELAVWLEAAGVDLDAFHRELAEAASEIKSKH
jgi:hypothetical protein